MYKTDPKKWREVLGSIVNPATFPKYFGGELVDPDGDPKCPTVVSQGGVVPKSYYITNLENTGEKIKYTEISVKKGTKHTLQFDVAEEGCLLR